MDELEELRKAVELYGKWEDRTKDYPHDEEGCLAHDAVVEAYQKWIKKV